MDIGRNRLKLVEIGGNLKICEKGQARVKIIIANPAVISSNPPEFRDK